MTDYDPTTYSGGTFPRTAELLREAQEQAKADEAAREAAAESDTTLVRTNANITNCVALCITTNDDGGDEPEPLAENEYLFEGRVGNEVVIRLFADGTLETGEGWKGERTGRLLLHQMIATSSGVSAPSTS